jgi:hypothetical protein
VKYFHNQKGFECLGDSQSFMYRMIQRMQNEINVDEKEMGDGYPLDSFIVWDDLIFKDLDE